MCEKIQDAVNYLIIQDAVNYLIIQDAGNYLTNNEELFFNFGYYLCIIGYYGIGCFGIVYYDFGFCPDTLFRAVYR